MGSARNVEERERERSRDDRRGGGGGESSSADEITPIFGFGRRDSSKDYRTARESGDSGGGASRRGSSLRSAGAGAGTDRERNSDNREGERALWWKMMADKYGTVELDNKGSVARDHLALGMFFFLSSFFASSPLSPSQPSPIHRPPHATAPLPPSLPSHLTFHPPPRTHLPRLAPHLASLRLHRHSRHATLPAQHDHLRTPRRSSPRLRARPLILTVTTTTTPSTKLPPPPSRQTARRHFPRHRHRRLVRRLSSLFRESALDHPWQVSRVQGEYRDYCARGWVVDCG